MVIYAIAIATLKHKNLKYFTGAVYDLPTIVESSLAGTNYLAKVQAEINWQI